MRSVLQLGKESGLGASSLRRLMIHIAGRTDSLRRAFAAHLIGHSYANAGGISSALGMPIDDDFQGLSQALVRARGPHFDARCRSGRLVLTDVVSGKPEARETTEAQLLLVAIECRDKQEVTDEVHGSVGCIRTSDRTTFPPVGFGRFSMGKDQRIATRNDVVYQGAFANVAILCSLVEQDSGDTGRYRKAFAEVLGKAAQAGGAALGVDAEATAGGSGWLNEVTLGLSNVVFDLLGADDDQFLPQVLPINAKEMQAHLEGRLETKVLRRPDAPQEVQYTHRQLLTGVDQGGDRGEYGFYFLLGTRTVQLPPDF